MTVGFHLALLGLVALLSPMAFAATLAVIRSGRLKALAFAAGFVSGQVAVCTILVALGGWSLPRRSSDYPTLRALLAIALGVWILSLAAGVRRRAKETLPRPNPRAQAVLDRLERVRPVTALAGGLLFGIGGPKRLLVSALAAASIATADVAGGRTAALIVWYSAIATAVVWAPVLAFELVGDRMVATIDAATETLARHQRDALFYALVAVGLIALANGVAALL